MKPLKYINLGCGAHFHEDWVNIDFVKTGKNVIAHNLISGIPFQNNLFDVVYHSHVLEHFSKKDAPFFIKECYRILKPDGILRIAVPDLEQIIIEYQKQLQKALNGDTNAVLNYDWIMLELFDQTVRNQSGGQMAKYLYQENLDNQEYIYQRIGSEAKKLRDLYLIRKEEHNVLKKTKSKLKVNIKYIIKRILQLLLGKKILHYLQIGKFRESGEIHQWMYDRYSITMLLKHCGFRDVTIKTAFESDIPDFSKYNLDVVKGEIRKPDSLFVEAYK